jgi:hypothetical protein
MVKDAARDLLGPIWNLDPPWLVATLVLLVLAYRLPQIIKAVSTAYQDNKRVNAEIRRKQHRVERELAEKQARIDRRKAKKAPESKKT